MPLRTNFTRFKEPRGFIKILELVIAILAFATTAGYYSEFTIKVTGPCIKKNTTTNKNITTNITTNITIHELVKFSYPFEDEDYYIDGDDCAGAKRGQHDLDTNFKSESEFFVFVGVVSFLYCIVAMVYYVSFEDPSKYGPGGTGRDIKSFSTVDFVVSLILAFFWFCGSVAWAVGLTSLKKETDADDYIKYAVECKLPGVSCSVLKNAGYATLTISVLFGFLNCFLWCANVWFAFKETIWHKEPGATTSAEQPSAEIPRQQVPKEESIQ